MGRNRMKYAQKVVKNNSFVYGHDAILQSNVG